MKAFTLSITAILGFLAVFLLFPREGHGNREAGRPEDETGRTGAMQALDFWTRARAYPDPDIAPDKFYKAYLYSTQQMRALERADGSGSSWESIGPINLPGRTISVAINPFNGNTVYAGSASGGLWRSYTGGLGNDWIRITTGFPVLGVGAIAIDPHDSSTMFIGTGEVYRNQGALGGVVVRTTRGSYGIGILKTTDAGASWTKSLDWTFNQERGVEAIRINPRNSNTILAATTEGLYKSMDGGQTWDLSIGVPMGEDIVIHPTDTSRILATFGDLSSGGSGLYYSSDEGVSWSSVVTFPGFTGKALLEPYGRNPNIVFASVADDTTSVSSLWKSQDFGTSWGLVSSEDVAGVQGWYSHFVAVKPDDSSRVVRGGVPTYYSTNGGVSNSPSSSIYSDNHAYAHHPVDPNILYVVNDDGIYRSTNFGVSFTSVGFGMQTGQFYNGFSNSTKDSLLAIGQVQDHIPGYRYTGSLVWGRTAVDECGWTCINPLNDGTMFAVNRNGGSVARSTDGGNSFWYVASLPALGSWNSPIIMAPSDTNVLYVGLDRVYKSVNRGANWASTNTSGFLDGNYSLSMAISYTSPDTVYVGKAPLGAPLRVLMTANGGGTWNDITGTLPNRYPMDLAVDPRNSRVVYAALGGSSSGHLFRSSDAGQHWSDLTGSLPDVPTTAVLVDPLNSATVYAGNDIGVYVSTNSGASWNTLSDGLPDAILISDLSMSQSNRMLRATTHGNGVFQRRMPGALPGLTLLSPNGGEAWDATTDHAITWSAALVPAARLEYSTDNGASWIRIADSVLTPPGSYTWHVPYPPTAAARVRLISLGGATVRDTSDAPFTITFHGSVHDVRSGWNMVSVPVRVADFHSTALFPAASQPAFDYEGSYQPKFVLANGPGYWLWYLSGQAAPVLGDSIPADTVAISAGWNLIGSISVPVISSGIASDPPGIVVSHYFGYSSGYQAVDTIAPGTGSWVKASAPGQLFLTGSLGKRAAAATARAELGSFNSLTITDASGSGQTLYFGPEGTGMDAGTFEMPPVPPEGVFDARFSSQRMVALSDPVKGSRIAILLSGGAYPLTLRWTMRNQGASLHADGREFALRDEGSLSIVRPPSPFELEMHPGPAAATPERFALLQNYPNPFNPATEIRFEIPVESRVVLKVYDVTGKEVATLTDGRRPSGAYSARWDASNMPSGIYYYHLDAGPFHQARAMVLIR